MAEYRLETPLKDEDIEKLKIGDTVYLSGVIYTARDAAHKRLVDLIKDGKELPFDIKGAVIYYVGPAPAKPGYPIGSAGPTTSYRMDPYAPVLLDNGLKGMIGKGPRSKEVIDAMVRNKAVYFAATGGAAALIALSVVSAEVIAYEDLGTEAVRKLVVKDFPCIVANDMYGNDMYKEGVEQFIKRGKI
ncbi:MAG TPA: Fe-S-containing hydro-lyase [Firmicutes bacterium]|uniref:Fe-S-containing hydro-lyase n=1 Tax=candidate division TA06 bacterium TaxID=2250710 RepID=A0A660S6M7_UNCT6|nr:Fe-S-containing hydro-lyase [candidate division WOR-3 bacterium]RKX64786.1 MAG: Fe-S-containing hydro-lyase [candidate division TA06 bacterium]HFD04812.1 Fe-S-containing hydro-lyase [Bacillota bacterium]